MSLENTGVVDAMGLDDRTGRVTLVIRHPGAWDGTDEQLYLLQEKLNAYLSFALDGELTEAHPDFAGKPLALRIDCMEEPDARTLGMLAQVRRQIAFQDITLTVHVHRPAGEA